MLKAALPRALRSDCCNRLSGSISGRVPSMSRTPGVKFEACSRVSRILGHRDSRPVAWLHL